MPLRLLIADDDRGTAHALGVILRQSGFDVQIALDGAQAIETAAAFNPDVLILDIGMPVIDGLEVAKQLRQRPGFEAKTFIALTGYGDQAMKDKASQAQFDEYLVKPFRLDTLMKILTDASNGQPAA